MTRDRLLRDTGELPTSAMFWGNGLPLHANQRQAQQYFDSLGGPQSDPDRLDGDGDVCDGCRRWISALPAVRVESEDQLVRSHASRLDRAA